MRWKQAYDAPDSRHSLINHIPLWRGFQHTREEFSRHDAAIIDCKISFTRVASHIFQGFTFSRKPYRGSDYGILRLEEITIKLAINHAIKTLVKAGDSWSGFALRAVSAERNRQETWSLDLLTSSMERRLEGLLSVVRDAMEGATEKLRLVKNIIDNFESSLEYVPESYLEQKGQSVVIAVPKAS